jgi:hypothetical protein
MGRIPVDEIAGFLVGRQIVCSDCLKDDERTNLKENQIIHKQSISEGEEMLFCDRCGKRL